MFCMVKKKNPAHQSKHQSNSEKKLILLMIPNKAGWNNIKVKELFALLRGITFRRYY